MLKVLGSSAATKYQIKRYFKEHEIEDRDDLIELYIKYGVQFGVEYELAIGMMLVYTNYLKNPIEQNNLCGIGLQFQVDKLESFDSEEECIIAQYEILRAGADFYYENDNPHSVTYTNLIDNKREDESERPLKGNIESISDVFERWNYADITEYTLEDLWIISRDITIIREEKKYYVNDRARYFFIVVATATKREPLYLMKRDLFRLGFTISSIVVDQGFYRLEVGKCNSEREATTIKNNLSIFGYTGTLKYREAKEDIENATKSTHE